MKTNKMILSITVFLALTLFALNSCKTESINEPSPTGPSSIGVILDLTASPNVLSASKDDRQAASITATLKKFDGIPLPDRTMYFKISSSRGVLGFFDDEVETLVKSTDADGTVKTKYYGPLYDEIGRDITLYIEVTVAWEGSQFISDSTPIFIIRHKD